MNEKMRLNKYLSLCGIGSRRKCDDYIERGSVSVNGKITREFGIRVDENDEVLFEGKRIQTEKITYIVLNKPVGVVTTLNDPEGRPTVAEYFENLPFIKPVGRLDYFTSGVLIMTNDGDLHYKLTHPKFQVAKLYRVILRGYVDENIKAHIKRGTRLDDGKVARGLVKDIKYNVDNTEIILELREGINREIRRIFEVLEYTIISLDRISFAGIENEGMQPGKWRYLDDSEIAILKKIN